MPRPDPYHRLMVRVRRRRQRRMAVTSVAGLAAVAVALPVVGTAGLSGSTGAALSPPPAVGTYQPASEIEGPMVRRLLDSPTRGNLAGDKALIADIEHQYRAARAELLVDPSLDDVKVLLANDAPGARSVVVAFMNDTHAVTREGIGDAGASVPALLKKTGTPNEAQALEPFLFSGRSSPVVGRHVADLAIGLGPAGCRVETSLDGRIQPDGTVSRSWQPAGTDGFIVRGAGQLAERWRFTCDGVVRYAGPSAGGATRVHPEPAAPSISTAGARGTVDPTLAASAARQLSEMLDRNGLTGAAPRVLWGGRLPDWVAGAPKAVLVSSCSTAGGCGALLTTGAIPSPRTATSWPTPDMAAVGQPDLTVTRVPGDAGGVLVVGPESAFRAELLDAKGRTIASGMLDTGAGAIQVDPPKVARVKLLDKDGRTLRIEATPGLGGNSGEFGEPTVWSW